MKFRNRHGITYYDTDWTAGIDYQDNEDDDDEEKRADDEDDGTDEENNEGDENLDTEEIEDLIANDIIRDHPGEDGTPMEATDDNETMETHELPSAESKQEEERPTP